MTLRYGPNLGQLIGAAAGEEHYQAILSQWRALDGLIQPAVSSRVTALPTADMLEGDRYLITGGSNANRIARYREANTEAGLAAGWEYFTPREGWYVWSIADKRGYRYSNGAWSDATFQGGTLTTALNEAPVATLASAATLAIGASSANTIQVTGNTAISAFDTIASGARRTLRFSDALTLTYDATKLILPRGANIVTSTGDVADFVSLGGGNWACIGYQRAGAPAARGDLGLGSFALANADAAPWVNLMPDSGRLAGRSNPLSVNCGDFAMSSFLSMYNGASASLAGKFIYDNTTYGGSRGDLTQAVISLLQAMGRPGTRYGIEFNVAQIDCGTGDAVSNYDYGFPPPDGITRYVSTTCQSRALFAASAYGTFVGWIRTTVGSIQIPRCYANGVLQPNGVVLKPATGWVHIRRVAQERVGYDNAWPHIFAEKSAVYQVGCPGFFCGDISVGLHAAPLPTITEANA